MARTFDDKPQIVVAREFHSSRHVCSISGFHGIHAGRGRPSVEPAADLRAARLIADEKGIVDVLKSSLTLRAIRRACARPE